VAGAEQDEHSRFDRTAGMLGMRVLCVGYETLCGRAVGGEKWRMCGDWRKVQNVLRLAQGSRSR